MTADEKTLANLEWCLHSPPVIQVPADPAWPPADWFRRLPMPDPDYRFEAPDSHRLGVHFEAVIQSWVQQSADMQLLVANLPVRDGGHTVGEFDMIVQHDGTTEHWELAVKFYLCVDDTTDTARFFGPNPADTLAAKLVRLRDHQLRLGGHPAAAALLAERGWQIDAARAFVKGRLFYPLAQWRTDNIRLPEVVHPEHERGWWCDLETFAGDAAFSGSHFYQLNKSSWLAPVTRFDDLQTHGDFCARLADSRHGTVHVAELDANGNERSRGFVVFPRWLNDVKKPLDS